MIGRRDLRLTRDQVGTWLTEWDQVGNIEDYLAAKVLAEGLDSTLVDMGDLGHLTVVEVLMEDLDSYARS